MRSRRTTKSDLLTALACGACFGISVSHKPTTPDLVAGILGAFFGLLIVLAPTPGPSKRDHEER